MTRPRRPSLAIACLLLLSGVGPASTQTLGAFAWQTAPYCNVVRLSVTVDGNAFHLTGFDDHCGGAQLPVAGSAVPRADELYAVSFYVVTPNGSVSHLTAAVHPTSFSGPWSDSSGETGTFVFSPQLPTGGSHRPPPRLPGTTIFTDSIAADQIAAGAVAGEEIANGSVTGAKLRLPLFASVNSGAVAFQVGNNGGGAAIRGDGNAPGQHRHLRIPRRWCEGPEQRWLWRVWRGNWQWRCDRSLWDEWRIWSRASAARRQP